METPAWSMGWCKTSSATHGVYHQKSIENPAEFLIQLDERWVLRRFWLSVNYALSPQSLTDQAAKWMYPELNWSRHFQIFLLTRSRSRSKSLLEKHNTVKHAGRSNNLWDVPIGFGRQISDLRELVLACFVGLNAWALTALVCIKVQLLHCHTYIKHMQTCIS